MRHGRWSKKMFAAMLAIFVLLFLLGIFKADELLVMSIVAFGLFVRSRLGTRPQGQYNPDSGCYFPDSAAGDHSYSHDGSSGHSCSDSGYSDSDGGGCSDSGGDGGGGDGDGGGD